MRQAAPVAAVLGGLLGLAGATAGLRAGIEPFATWYYQFAWYSVLLGLDGAAAWSGASGRKGEFLLLGRPRHLASLLSWSAVVWYFFELWNFRLQNWYYINMPHGAVLRWASTALAFGTVLPAIFLTAALLDRAGLARRLQWRPLPVSARALTRIQVAGAIMVVLVLAWPRYCFPLVWAAVALLVEPWVYARAPRRSLLHDLSIGQPGRVLRLLAGGALVGFVWELLNIGARAKWIYTVPFFEHLKLFEMPLPGFFGFPPFAVECFVLWQALVVLGLGVPRFGRRRSRSAAGRGSAGVLAVGCCILVSLGMDARTVASLQPRLADLDIDAASLEEQGIDVFRLAAAQPAAIARLANVDDSLAVSWVERARLATMRGIGVEGVQALAVVGVNSLAALAAADPARLVSELERATGRDLVAARVRVWIRGARRLTGG